MRRRYYSVHGLGAMVAAAGERRPRLGKVAQMDREYLEVVSYDNDDDTRVAVCST